MSETNKPGTIDLTFVILDNGPDARDNLKKIVQTTVESACTQVGLDSKLVLPTVLLEASNLRQAKEFIETSDKLASWLLVDEKLEGESGKELVTLVSKLGYPADVLYYSRATPARILKDANHRYGKVRSGVWGQLDPIIAIMTQEFLTKWTDPEYIRGLVLSRAVDVDVAMDNFLITFFNVEDNLEPTFRGKILGPHGAQLGARMDILEKAIGIIDKIATPEESLLYQKVSTKDIKAIFEFRDLFAHNMLERDKTKPFDFALVHKSGSSNPYGRKTLQEYFLNCSRRLVGLQTINRALKKLGETKKTKIMKTAGRTTARKTK